MQIIMNSKTFCLAPWVHTCVSSTGNLSPCCQWKSSQKTNFQEFDSWINSQYLQDIRQRMYDGEQITECSKCWHDESIGKRSLRMIYNKEFAKFVNQDIVNTSWIAENSVYTLDLKLGNLCNLKCVMCNPAASSQLLSEFKTNSAQFRSLKTYSLEFLDKDFSWPITDEFEKFLRKFQSQIKWIKFTGGEPTIIPYVFDLLDNIDNPEDVTVSFSTNATKIDQNFVDKIKKFKTVWISVSLEGIADHNDQLRFLSDWNEIEKNILRICNLPNVYFSISHVLQCFSVTTFIPLIEWCEKYQISLSIIPLVNPDYLQLNSVRTDIITNFVQRLEKLDLNKNQLVVKQVLSHLKTHKYSEDLDQKRLQNLKLIDSIRSTTTNQIIKEQYEPSPV